VNVVEKRRSRTLGDLFELRKEACRGLAAAQERQNEVLSRVYGGLTGPPDTGRWNAYPHHRTLFCHPPRRESMQAVRFGWSRREVYHGGRDTGWLMSYSQDWYTGYDDRRLIRDVCGREPKGAIDELLCVSEVAKFLDGNDEALALEFDAVTHRVNQLFLRRGLVSAEITVSVQSLLGRRHGWWADKNEAWRRVTFEDGTIITVTSEGEVIFGDVIVNHNLSLHDPSTKRYVNPDLAERHRLAQESR